MKFYDKGDSLPRSREILKSWRFRGNLQKFRENDVKQRVQLQDSLAAKQIVEKETNQKWPNEEEEELMFKTQIIKKRLLGDKVSRLFEDQPVVTKSSFVDTVLAKRAFEDVTSSSSHAVFSTALDNYTEEDLLANTVYFFLVMVLATVVIGVAAFGIREYTLSIRNKPKSAEWEDKNHEEEQEEPQYLEENPPRALSLLQKGLEFNKPTANGLLQESNVFEKVIDTTPFVYGFSSPSSANDSLAVTNVKLEVIGDDLTPGFTGGIELLDTKVSGHETQFYTSTSKPVYGLKQMMEVKQNNLVFHHKSIGETIKLSEIVKFSVAFPQKKFETAWEAEKAIEEIRGSILELYDQILAAELLCIGASHSILDNENYYMLAFNEFMVQFVDSADIFHNINVYENITIQILMIEMAMIYCWSHWNFHQIEAKEKIYEKFRQWKSGDPTLQSHDIVFRLLCNLKLGLQILPESTVRKELDFRVQMLFRECVKTCQCHGFGEFVPMLCKAVNNTTKQSSKYFFYDILYLMITQHSQCCMNEYLQQQEHSAHLKALVQHGLWHNHDRRLTLKVQEIHQFLMPHHDEVKGWYQEVLGGRKLVSAMAAAAAGEAICTQSADRPHTPGSWKYFS